MTQHYFTKCRFTKYRFTKYQEHHLAQGSTRRLARGSARGSAQSDYGSRVGFSFASVGSVGRQWAAETIFSCRYLPRSTAVITTIRASLCSSLLAILTVLAVISIVLVSLHKPVLAKDEPQSYEQGQKYYKSGHFGKAREIWTKSAAQGDVKSRYRLGMLYEEGTVVTKDLVEAHLWYSLASESGNKKADRARFRIETSMSDEQLLNAQALLAEFGPLYNPPAENDAEVADSAQDNADTTIDANVFMAVPGSAEKNAQQAESDLIANAPNAPVPAQNSDVTTADKKVGSTNVDAKDQQPPVDDTTKDIPATDRQARRLKLLNASGPGPEVVGSPAKFEAVDDDASIEDRAEDLTAAEQTADEKFSRHIAEATKIALEQKRQAEQLAAQKLAQQQQESNAAETATDTDMETVQAVDNTQVDDKNVSDAPPEPTSDSPRLPPEAAVVRSVEASNLEQLVEEPEVPLPTLALADPYPDTEDDSSAASASLGFTLSSDDRDGVKRIQTMLSELGYQIRGEPGDIGPETRKAIKAFRRDSSLLISTLIDVDFLATLYARHAALEK